jgi:hypothetical protein
LRANIILAAILLADTNAALSAEWWENMKITGDLRYRHEMIKEGDSETRNRHRIRARLGVESEVNDFTKAGVQLATGSDDPVSTNQTLSDGFSTKSLMLDLAYFTIRSTLIPGLSVTGGKFKNPFFKPGDSELLWDSDLDPEGGTFNYQKRFKALSLTFIGAGLWIEERSSGEDSWMGAGQALLGIELHQNKSSVTLGGGFYNYFNAAGYRPYFDGTEPMGNSIDTLGNYLNGYEITEVFVEVAYSFKYFPVTVMADFAANSAAEDFNNGWLAGIRAGKTKKPGSWDFRYIYRKIEKDAVVGIFTDSDFRGGGTDARGHEIGGGYQIANNMKFSATYFINTIGLKKKETTDFDRLQLDLQLKF